MQGSAPSSLVRGGRPRRPGLAATLAFAILFGTSAVAEAARKKVAIFPFSGPDGAAIEEGVVAVLQQTYTVVPSADVAKAVRAVASQASDADAAIGLAARRLGADAVLAGRIKKKAKWELEIQVRNGADGSVVESLVFDLRDPEVDDRTATRMASDIAEALTRTKRGAPLKTDDAPSEESRPVTKTKPARDEGEAEDSKPVAKSKAREEAADEAPPPEKKKIASAEAKPPAKPKGKGKETAEAAEEKPEPVVVRKAVRDDDKPDEPGMFEKAWAAAHIAHHLVDAYGGFGFVSRSFAYDNGDLQSYSGGGLGFVLGAESFPLVNRGMGHLSQLGVGGSFGIEPFGSAAVGSASAPIVQRRWTFDFKYAWKTGEHTMLVPSLGLGQVFFSIRDKKFIHPSECTTMQTDLCLANVIVIAARLGAEGRLQIAPSVAAHAGLYFQPGLKVSSDAGQVASEGADRAFGFTGELGLTVKVWRWVGVRAAFEYTSFIHLLAPDVGMGPDYSSATDAYSIVTLAGTFQYDLGN